MDLQTGMLWFDDARDRTLAEKIERAVSYYHAKYGRAPNTCYVPLPLATAPNSEGISIKGAADILPDHLWLGVV